MKHKRQLSVVIDREQYQAIEKDAADRGISVAEFARCRLLQKPLPPTRDDDHDSAKDAE